MIIKVGFFLVIFFEKNYQRFRLLCLWTLLVDSYNLSVIRKEKLLSIVNLAPMGGGKLLHLFDGKISGWKELSSY